MDSNNNNTGVDHPISTEERDAEVNNVNSSVNSPSRSEELEAGSNSDNSVIGGAEAAPIRRFVAMSISIQEGRYVSPSELRSTDDHQYYLPERDSESD